MEQIYKYIEEHAAQQSEALSWVQKQTHIRTNHARMLSGTVQGQLMRMIVQMTGAKRILELGTFTATQPYVWLRHSRQTATLTLSNSTTNSRI